MRPIVRLTSPDNPRIKQVAHLRKQRDRRAEGVFVAEGLREVGRAFESGLVLRDLFYSPELIGTDLVAVLPAVASAASQATIYEVPTPLLLKMTYRDDPEGVLAVFDAPVWHWADLAKGRTGPDLWLVAAGTEKPGNLGAMARSAEAAGAWGVLVADGQVDPFNPNAIRASTGAVFSLPIVSGTGDQIRQFLRNRNVGLVAASPDGSAGYTQVDLTRPIAMVIGAEDRGLDEEWRSAATQLVKIPMRGQVVDSLNASIAAAIMLFEAVRQRTR